MKYQKGQSVLEFAIVLPFLLLILLGMILVSMVMADYLALSNIARSSAREAAVTVIKYEVDNGYPKVREKYIDYKLPVDIYDLDQEKDFKIEFKQGKEINNVTVTINARLNKNGSALAKIVEGLANKTKRDLNLKVTYTMCSEYK
ncbi:TadE/TadG family type IV pilus assembly protein [Selenomonas ruminantium]|uniref:TadE/TadG family type IV pilus assembly protein n=1 Tax=Selenomonas ruminantium TaxID=971 RepID=UPI0026F2446A|nr:TadE/TadG family type IV pilus assembly protein [Selenomonas ruminantium]